MTPADLLARLRELDHDGGFHATGELWRLLPDLIAALARAEKMEQDVTRLSAALCAIHAEVQKHFGVVQTKATTTPGATDETR